MLEILGGGSKLKPLYKMTQMPSRPVAASHVSCCYYEGKIYAVGGLNVNTNAIANFNVFDIESQTWENLPNSPRVRRSAAMAGYNGKIFVYGGHTQNAGTLNQTDIYDITTRTWSVGPAGIQRGEMAYIPVGDRLYVFGGIQTGNTGLNTISYLKLSDPVGWTNIATEAGFRYTGVLHDKLRKKLYLAGGQINTALTDQFKSFDLEAGVFETLTSFPTPSHSLGGLYEDGNHLFYSGYNGGYSSKIYSYSVEKNSWEEYPLQGNGYIHGLATGVQVNDSLYLVGGYNGSARHANVTRIDRAN